MESGTYLTLTFVTSIPIAVALIWFIQPLTSPIFGDRLSIKKQWKNLKILSIIKPKKMKTLFVIVIKGICQYKRKMEKIGVLNVDMK